MNRGLYLRRQLTNRIALGLTVAATIFGLFWLAWLLFTLLKNGLQWINLAVLTEPTPPPGGQGGLANSIVGSLVLTTVGVVLGARTSRVVFKIVYRASLPGIVTGILLGIARISGETAPLLFTALNNQFWSTDLSRPFPNLPVVIFQFAMSPYRDWQQLAWAGALIITVTVLLVNIIARVLSRGRTR